MVKLMAHLTEKIKYNLVGLNCPLETKECFPEAIGGIMAEALRE
jgi:hypothetical protein